MVCFSAKLKKKCSVFMLILGALNFILGVVICTYGYMKLGEGKDLIKENDYAEVDVGSLGQLLALIAGILCVLTGILGILTSRCY